ncbi:auxin-responsive protein IAA29-like [Tripterygium wilfordii]|uniref:auxin-responsive protein IAA29-like n=1 Tax=Tripterygium wilfordii TaxID=458696 RepID=UPI0018F8498E|nr:auxin-responsive protein IAA29-like [Tripterygium wilfordii]
MELQLGLALPGNPVNVVQLGPAFSTDFSVSDSSYRKKRSFDDAFHEEMPRTLQLLVWNDSPNKDDDDRKYTDETPCVTNNNDDGNGGSLVGWPPIKCCWKKKKLFRDNYDRESEEINSMTQETSGSFNGRLQSNSMYVKVKLEGVGIARKIDLSLHHSYQTLTDTLLSMFDICNDNYRNYMLAYEDKEGDWLLADEHVPWRVFVGSVERLKLLRRE